MYKALHDDVRLVAVKLLNTGGTGNAAQTQMFWREIEQLAECRDAHLLQFYGEPHLEKSEKIHWTGCSSCSQCVQAVTASLSAAH